MKNNLVFEEVKKTVEAIRYFPNVGLHAWKQDNNYQPLYLLDG
jgi:hypothetical protein